MVWSILDSEDEVSTAHSGTVKAPVRHATRSQAISVCTDCYTSAQWQSCDIIEDDLCPEDAASMRRATNAFRSEWGARATLAPAPCFASCEGSCDRCDSFFSASYCQSCASTLGGDRWHAVASYPA